MRPRAWLAVAVDIVWVLVFVVIGRASHASGEALGGIASTAWPFLAGLGAGWLVLFLLWHRVLPWHRVLLWHRVRGARPVPAFGILPAGVVAWLATVAVGMSLRVVGGQGTAVAFIVVALAFLGLFLLGWRLLLRGAARLALRKLPRPLYPSYPLVMPFPASSSCPRQCVR
ncbi:MAG TPA: DUF3054 domain-containing protein [Trebonia sp.]|jgi:hypothetical protein|nr:DUF3054 domain-containing protein [Trebonia sp.]